MRRPLRLDLAPRGGSDEPAQRPHAWRSSEKQQRSVGLLLRLPPSDAMIRFASSSPSVLKATYLCEVGDCMRLSRPFFGFLIINKPNFVKSGSFASTWQLSPLL
eukprot:TRINITY_DN9953_c0_g1_i1.p1 TRINITY_DN9953_c0_g1~~TRINITY_DN9953_c0_g1_i1.p1  ORF type:complete len:104 (-),score=10.97 TRINITY_DN9953_c0_g1_i1:156-467(-)